MASTVLLTSFDIWKSHHISNSSDDLVAAIQQRGWLSETTHLLRKLPVCFQTAPEQVISKITELQPDLIICCGMAETRQQLTVESNGKHQGEVLKTTIDLETLVATLTVTEVSHDAGNFVCNYLYYAILKHTQTLPTVSRSLFVHVPLLHPGNQEPILQDFRSLLHSCQHQ
ncbi:peptidase C15 [Pantanalinema sp. GBBB05]|uniref:pyroglutamyl-peptidase I family protein n=1 Tax=Pantanalinema sp. GBBB05 TaxID=2604139 RepID=UPI001DCE1F8D|nr:peptidase C15 [Pantanalinema sp. GBBB05]